MLDLEKIISDFESLGYSSITMPEGFWEKMNTFKKVSLDFFKSEQEMPKTLSPKFISGYRNIGTEYSQHPSRMDLMEAISLPIELLKTDSNVFSSKFESFFSSIGLDLFELAETISSELNRNYGNPSNSIYCSSHSSFFQVSHYEPCLHERDTLQDVHDDGNLFTLIWANAPALEIVKKGFNIPIGFQKPEVYIMPGKILSLLTGNKIKPCEHVVKRHKNQQHRVSFMCFVNPSIRKPIKAWILNEYNQGKCIRKEVQFHSVAFGLSPIKEL